MPPKKVLAKGKKEVAKRSRSAAEPTKPTKKVAKAEGDSDVKVAKKTGSKTSVAGGEAAYEVPANVPNRDSYKVTDDYFCLLNQSNLDANNNKFYKLCVLESGGKFSFFSSWGRVGEPGQSSFLQNLSKEAAIDAFNQKFKDKTGNFWGASPFVKKDGKYQIVEVEKKKKGEASSGGGDADSPLGKLTKAQLELGLETLGDLKKIVQKKKLTPADNDQVVKLSSKFFSLIPTDIGRKNAASLILKTSDAVEEKEAHIKFMLRMAYDGVDEKTPAASTKTPAGKAGAAGPLTGLLSYPVPPTLKAALPQPQYTWEVQSADQAGVKFEKTQPGKPNPKMPASLFAAIAEYTCGAYWSKLNADLRSEDPSKIRPHFPFLRMLFKAAEHLQPKKLTVWRGIGVDLSKEYTVGKTITWFAVSSTTTAKKVAEEFCQYGCKGVATFCTIEAKTLADISDISFFPYQKEHLLMPGTQLKVKSAKMDGKVFRVDLEEVGRLVS